MIFFLSGCVETVNNHIYFSERLTETYLYSRWLPSLEAGITTQKQLVGELGEPSGLFENGKINKLTAAKKKKVLKINEQFAKQALRVLGFAYKPVKGKDYQIQDGDILHFLFNV